MNKIRIASVVHNSVRNDARVLKEAKSLQSAGHEVTVFGLDPHNESHFTAANGVPVRLAHRDQSGAKARIEADGLPPTRENIVRASFREQADRAFELVRSIMRPDVVHIHDHVALNAAQRYKDEWNTPIVWDAHEIYDDLAGVNDARAVVNPRIIGDNQFLVDRFVTLNQSIADYYEERYPALPPATLIPNATEYRHLKPYDGRLHRAAGLTAGQKILLFQGGFSEHRGIRLMLDAAPYLDDQWSVVFMGWGSLEPTIKEYAHRLGAHADGNPRIACIPGAPHEELQEWTTGASLGAIPYEAIGLNHLFCTPNKLWEYPAAGVPIIATNLPELARHLHTFGIGFTVDRTVAPSALAEAVNALSESDLARVRQSCLDFAARDSWQAHEKKLVELYSSLERELQRVSAYGDVDC